MTTYPPPYAPAPEESSLLSKGELCPSVPPEQYQQPPPQSVGYYPQQPAPGGSPGYYPAQQQQQQPHQQIVVTQPPVVVGQQQHLPSYLLHIILSSCICFCCFSVCGLAALILAGKYISYHRHHHRTFKFKHF